MVERWNDLTEEARNELEQRLIVGMPKTLFRDDAHSDERDWEQTRDRYTFLQLERLRSAGTNLSGRALQHLEAIRARNPNWRSGAGDRDDFTVWYSSSVGPQGDPNRLAEVPVDQLVERAIKLQKVEAWANKDVWRVLCGADPARALNALSTQADNSNWNVDAWRPFFWEQSEEVTEDVLLKTLKEIERFPPAIFDALADNVVSWLRRQWTNFGGIVHKIALDKGLLLWDRLAKTAFSGSKDQTGQISDLGYDILNGLPGVLAWILMDALGKLDPKKGEKLPQHLVGRFDTLAAASGKPGKIARAHLASKLSYLHYVDPNWVAERIVQHFRWESGEAPDLWKAQTFDRVPAPDLFQLLKNSLISGFMTRRFGSEYRNLVGHLIHPGLWNTGEDNPRYAITTNVIKNALRRSVPPIRRSAAWHFFHWMKGEETEPPFDHAERWRTKVGPYFIAAWPNDAHLRDRQTSHFLVWMALECGDAFPDAVDAIVNALVPSPVHFIRIELRSGHSGKDQLQRFPSAYTKLIRAVVDLEAEQAPVDLGEVLHGLEVADPEITKNRDFIVLDAYWRRAGPVS
jgi:hypothetical protein